MTRTLFNRLAKEVTPLKINKPVNKGFFISKLDELEFPVVKGKGTDKFLLGDRRAYAVKYDQLYTKFNLIKDFTLSSDVASVSVQATLTRLMTHWVQEFSFVNTTSKFLYFRNKNSFYMFSKKDGLGD